MSIERFGGIRFTIAIEAARLMYEEGVKQYFTAKRLAAKRVLGRSTGGRTMRYRPQDLPSNGEIRDALLALAELAEGSRRTRRLFAMRVVALEAMRALAPFAPRLIGSVSTGHIRKGSDIDLQVFVDDPEALELHLRELGWLFERELTTILKFGQIREYIHFHVADAFPLELTAYEPRELRFRPRSSTDGKPIVRVRESALVKLLEKEHPEEWARYQRVGEIEDLDALLAEDDDDEDTVADGEGSLAGMIDEGPAEEELWLPEPGEEEDPEQIYDPLPGFEQTG